MADDLKGQLQAEVELKSGADRFFKFWKSEVHQAPNHTPTNIQAVRIHEGDWETSGSIKIWEGKAGVFKERVELEEEKKIVKLTGQEGDVFMLYKVYNGTWHVMPKGEGALAKLTLEYEKLNKNVPAPYIYLDFMISMTKDIDAGLIKA